jgi:hypothetical protein
MRYLRPIPGILFWLLAAVVPLLPPLVLKTYSVKVCTDVGICFEPGVRLMDAQGMALFELSLALLWPMCLWQLIGRPLWLRVRGHTSTNRARAVRHAAIVTSIVYWLAVALIPLTQWHILGMDALNYDCWRKPDDPVPLLLPLDGRGVAAVLLACAVLWPLCYRKIAHRTLPAPP